MRVRRKERAAATANSDRPVKIKFHTSNSITSDLRNQERFSSNCGRVLRWINAQRQLYTPIKSITSDLKKDDIRTKEVCHSISYLSAKSYISTTKNGEAVKITPQGIRLLAGSLTDDNVAI